MSPHGTHASYRRGCHCEECRAAYIEYWRDYYERHRDALTERGRRSRNAHLVRENERIQRWRLANPEKIHAHRAVERAIRNGRLRAMPCEVCGAPAEAHHDDYGRLLDVRWLCRSHHRRLHCEARAQVAS